MKSIISLSCACALVFAACQKPKPAPTPEPPAKTTFVDTIAARGCFFTGESIPFYGNVKSPSIRIKTMMWDFGDASPRSFSQTPEHTYANPGTYTITLTINGEAVTKTVTISDHPSSPYTEATKGQRKWVGTGNGIIRELQYDTLYGASTPFKQSFYISPYGNQVRFFDVTLSLSSVDEVAKTLTFTDCGENTRKLVYYYATDSMTYSSNWGAGDRSGSFEIHTVR